MEQATRPSSRKSGVRCVLSSGAVKSLLIAKCKKSRSTKSNGKIPYSYHVKLKEMSYSYPEILLARNASWQSFPHRTGAELCGAGGKTGS
jgi:hypothetical protein